MTPWSVCVSPMARGSLLALSDAAFADVSEAIELLRTTPYLGSEYQPAYEAALLPFACRVTYVGNYGIYYTPDDEKRELYVRFIEDQRMDPRRRFQGRLGNQ